MAGVYVDTSALGRVLLAEPDAAAIAKTLASYEEQWSSEPVAVELGRLGKLRGLQADAQQLLATVNLVRSQALDSDPPRLLSPPMCQRSMRSTSAATMPIRPSGRTSRRPDPGQAGSWLSLRICLSKTVAGA
jgi:hypothetical protein